MPTDALLTIAAPGVQTATFHSAAITLPKSTQLRPLFSRVIYNGAANASGANAWTLNVDVSYDNAATWSELIGAAPINLSTTAVAGEVTMPVQITRPDLINQQTIAPQCRVTGTLSGAGSTPTITISSIEWSPSRV